MNGEQWAYIAFLSGCAIMVVCPFIVGFWKLASPPKPKDSKIDIANSTVFARIVFVSCVALILLGVMGFNHTIHVTPHQFVTEFNQVRLGGYIR